MNSTVIDDTTLFSKWMSWRDKTLEIKSLSPEFSPSGRSTIHYNIKQSHNKVRHICESLGFKENIDYIIRNSTLRFRDTTDLGMFRLIWERE